MTRTNRLQRTLVWTAVVAIVLVGAPGCAVQPSGNAQGAATPEELVRRYEEAHREHSVEKLRDLLWWEAAQAGGRRRNDLEGPMVELFDIDLDKVEYIEAPAPDPVSGGSIYYARRRPGVQLQLDSMIGPVYGKMILLGSVRDGARDRAVRIDPSYIVMQSDDRYYIDILRPVVEDVVTSVRTGEPSRSQPVPFDVDPRTLK